MSKKGWGIGVAIVAAALVGSPTIIGSQTESSLREHVQLFDQAQPAYSLEVISYDRGWFSSTAELRLGMDLPMLLNDPEIKAVSTTIELSLQHGPILTDNGFALGLASWQAKNSGKGLEKYVQWDQTQPFFLQQGSVNLFGKAVYQDYIPRLENTTELSELTFSLTEYRGDGVYANGELYYQGNYEQFKLAVEDGLAVELNAMAINLDASADIKTLIIGTFYPSVMTFTVGQMRASTPDEELFLMSRLVSDFALKESEDGSLAHMHMGHSAAELFVAGTEVNNLRMMTQFNNIDRAFLEDYLASMKTIVGVDDPEVLQAMMTSMFAQHKDALLMAQPELSIPDAGFSMAEGTLDSSMLVSIAELEQIPAELDEQFLLQNLIANANIAVDKALAERLAKVYVKSMLAMMNPGTMDAAELEQMAEQQATMVLQNFVQQGMLKVDEEHYLFNAEIAQGILNLNGQSIPLGQML